jgi:hypothetical protein
MTACRETDIPSDTGQTVSAGNVIRVGGVSADGIVVRSSITRADGDAVDEETVTKTPAENIDWLRDPLFEGLDITYGDLDNRAETQRVAVLKLKRDASGPNGIEYSNFTEDGVAKSLATYSFNYRNNTTGEEDVNAPALWYDNGAHFFEGVHVPELIVNGKTGFPADLTKDQHDDGTTAPLGNYTLLSRYLAMPANFTLSATVGRILLPFRHRLARVLAYILIDPEMGTDVTIRGYKQDNNGDATAVEDPTNSDIRFCNVKVLSGVDDVMTSLHHTYTPRWKEERKAIPHFVGERGSYDDSKNQYVAGYEDHFITFYNTTKKTYVYPTDPEWSTINKTFANEAAPATGVTVKVGEWERKVYGKVPVYDLIVQPTYSSADRVMYDEDLTEQSASQWAAPENKIDFELTLSNGLIYAKEFIFDLNANDQTVVYLHISRERVDYSSSGSQLWQETSGYDDWYGVNNENGNTLSIAGSSWQRAYTYNPDGVGTVPSPFADNVTDGHYYTADGEDAYAQYVTRERFIEMLRQAHEGGKHHGDYFILREDISIPAAAFPDDFVFTGHLDGLDHTITITGDPYTEVTQRAYDSYEAYDSHTDTRYVRLAQDNYQIFTPTAGTTYYSRSNSGTAADPVYEYSPIADLTSYDGPTVYVRIGEPVVSYTETAKAEATGDGTTYYEKVNEGTEQEPVYTYSAISDLSTFEGDVVYEQVVTYTYSSIDFYKMVHHAEETRTVEGKTPTSLFAGLDGKYDAQVGEANVHLEKGILVPTKTSTDGWRAEVINVNVKGGKLFPEGTTYPSEDAASKVTGHVRNCWEGGTSYNTTTHRWEGGTRVDDYIPSIPEY